jgi:hypothetical protein
MNRKEQSRESTFRREMYRGNRAMAGVFLAGGIAMSAVFGGVAIATIASEKESIAPYVQNLSAEEIKKLNEHIVFEEIMITISALGSVGIAALSGYLAHGYNEIAKGWVAKKPEEDK